jgi:hypothetical protein
MEGRNDSPQSRIVLAEYWFRSVVSEHMHAFCMRWLSQYAGWRHAGAVTNPISFTESDAKSDVASAATSLVLILGRLNGTSSRYKNGSPRGNRRKLRLGPGKGVKVSLGWKFSCRSGRCNQLRSAFAYLDNRAPRSSKVELSSCQDFRRARHNVRRSKSRGTR